MPEILGKQFFPGIVCETRPKCSRMYILRYYDIDTYIPCDGYHSDCSIWQPYLTPTPFYLSMMTCIHTHTRTHAHWLRTHIRAAVRVLSHTLCSVAFVVHGEWQPFVTSRQGTSNDHRIKQLGGIASIRLNSTQENSNQAHTRRNNLYKRDKLKTLFLLLLYFPVFSSYIFAFYTSWEVFFALFSHFYPFFCLSLALTVVRNIAVVCPKSSHVSKY